MLDQVKRSDIAIVQISIEVGESIGFGYDLSDTQVRRMCWINVIYFLW